MKEAKGDIIILTEGDQTFKAADVKIVSKEKSTAALITIKIVGEVAAVKSAVGDIMGSARRSQLPG